MLENSQEPFTNFVETQEDKEPEDENSAKPGLATNLNFDEKTQKVDLADLCSGQFLTVPEEPSGLSNLVQETASQPSDIADLCSGQFVSQTQGETGGIKNLINTVEETQNIEDLCSGQFVTQPGAEAVPKNLGDFVDGKDSQTQDLAALCSGKFETQAEEIAQEPKSAVKIQL